MLDKYRQFLEKLDIELSNYFGEQCNYVFCKEGCYDCCQMGQYPMSQIEFEYLKVAYKALPLEKTKIVDSRVKKLKKEYEKHKNKSCSKNFEHACPFLVGRSCCIYQNRPIICRTFGLIKSAKMLDGTEVAILPDCLHKGLNYSNVFNFLKNDFGDEKIAQFKDCTPPMTYDISLQSIYEKNQNNIDFSYRKTMIEFLKDL